MYGSRPNGGLLPCQSEARDDERSWFLFQTKFTAFQKGLMGPNFTLRTEYVEGFIRSNDNLAIYQRCQMSPFSSL